MGEAETKLKQERIKLRKIRSLIDYAIGYFSKDGEPEEFKGIKEFLERRRDKLQDRLNEIEKELKYIRASK